MLNLLGTQFQVHSGTPCLHNNLVLLKNVLNEDFSQNVTQVIVNLIKCYSHEMWMCGFLHFDPFMGGRFFMASACTFVLPVISYFRLDRESLHCCIISFSANSFYSLQQVFTEKCWCLLICFLSYKCAYAWFVVKLAFLTALNVICTALQDCYIEQTWLGVVILCNYHH